MSPNNSPLTKAQQRQQIKPVIMLGLEFLPFSGRTWREFPCADEGSLCCVTERATLILTGDRKRILEYPKDGQDEGEDFVREWQLDYSA